MTEQDETMNTTQPPAEAMPQSAEAVPDGMTIPDELAVLPLFNMIVYPMTVTPLAVGQEASIRLIDDAMVGQRLIALVALKNEEQRPDTITADDFYTIGTAAIVHRLLRLPDNTLRVAIQGIERIKIEEIVQTEPYLRARVRVLPDQNEDGIEVQALMRNLVGLATQMLELLPNTSEELQVQITNEDDPRRLAYLIAVTILFRSSVAERQEVLELSSVRAKLKRLTEILTRELEVLRIGQEIQSQVQSGIDRNQREYVLREQMRAIQRELGESDENVAEVERLRAMVDEAGMTGEALEQANRELDRLSKMPPAAAEYGIIRSYIETLADLPWNRHTDDQLDIGHAQTVLDEDHYDLEDIKRRILEYLAVRMIRRERIGDRAANPRGAILCFVGPPGVGKTSLGRSIARAMGREFVRLSLGGVRDEAEIRGHRRTYIGAMPGSIIQTIRRVGVNNPVMMLDEIDKLGADFRGDPSSALLEVLDPEQNNSFRDHYLDVAWDLSPVMFIATANTLQTIPPPLLDRMEVIQLAGYTVREKLEIARRYLLPEQIAEHALTDADIEVTDDALRVAIEEYTREAGVRNLEREIANICRKVAVAVARRTTEDHTPIVVDAAKAREYLGRQRFFAEASEQIDRPGIVTGLVWTPVGGDIIFIEATAMPGSRGFVLTGQLGDVMKESARAALSYVRAESDKIGIDPHFYENSRYPHARPGGCRAEGRAISRHRHDHRAGLAADRATGKRECAMTGEITLRGKVLPVGGIREKVLAAHRAGIRTVILPKRNVDDLDEIPDEVRRDLTMVPVERMEEVLDAALEPRQTEPPVMPTNGHADAAPRGRGGMEIEDTNESVETPESS